MLDFENANEVFDVYGVYPHEKRGVEHHLLGRFYIEDKQLRVIEDHEGLLKRMLINGPIEQNLRQLNSLATSAYTRIVSESDVKEGQHIELLPGKEPPTQDQPQPQQPPDMIEEHDGAPLTQGVFEVGQPPAIFDYLSVGMGQPQILEVRDGTVFMNGRQLSQVAVDRILYTLKSGTGKLRYRKKV